MPGGCGFGRSGIGYGSAVLSGNVFGVDLRARCIAASPPARRSLELSGGGCSPVPEPMPASPREIAGLSSSASAGPIGCTSGRCALDFGVLGDFFEVSGDFAIGQIWDESGLDERARRFSEAGRRGVAPRPPFASPSVRDQMVVLEPDRSHIVARLSQRPYADLVKADLQILLVDVNAKISVIVVIIFREDEVLHLGERVLALEIFDVLAGMRFDGRLSFARSNQRVDVVPAVSANDEGDVDLLALELHNSRIALHVVRVRGEKGMRVDAFLVANRVDLAKHGRAGAVIAAGAL